MAGPPRGTEGVPAAGVGLDELTRARFDLDAVGHYARPEDIALTMDRTPRATVHADATGTTADGLTRS